MIDFSSMISEDKNSKISMKSPKLLYTRDQIVKRVEEVGAELTSKLEEGAIIVGVLKGCLPFMADLVRKIDVPVEIDFLALSAFERLCLSLTVSPPIVSAVVLLTNPA